AVAASPATSASAATSSVAASEPASTPGAVKGAPPERDNPTFKLGKERRGPGHTSTVEYKITWTEPNGAADSFLVFGLPDCLRYSKAFDNNSCVARGMRIPADKLVQIGVAPGDQRSLTVSWDLAETGPGPYSAILIRATSAKGNSIFTIVHSDDVCFKCVY